MISGITRRVGMRKTQPKKKNPTYLIKLISYIFWITIAFVVNSY